MSMKLPVLSGMKLLKLLIKEGFEVKGRTSSHVTLKKGEYRTTIVLHKEIGHGLLRDIIRQAGYTRDEFIKLIKKS